MNRTENSVSRRDPETVMRASRLGSFHQCRLSFMRTLTRRMAYDNWQCHRSLFELNSSGVGRAVYTVKGPRRQYSLVAFAHDISDAQRSDRVIAEAWDTTFVLFDGVPTPADLDRLYENVPYQESGRLTDSELTLSRANRSVRLWDIVVDALANGDQPDREEIRRVGYLLRTTAVYGSGKFGAADREYIEDRPELYPPFQAELLTVYLIRSFARDLVQHAAYAKGGDQATALDPAIAKELGIGNSTGLGMAPFIVNHPILFSNWIMAREEAIARIRNCQLATIEQRRCFRQVLRCSEISISYWTSNHPIQTEKLAALRTDINLVNKYISGKNNWNNYPWNELIIWSETSLSVEGQEFVASLILEPYGHLVDGLSDCMSDVNRGAFVIDGAMTVSETRSLLEKSFGWALKLDWTERKHCSRVWYVSAEKLEPRLGERFEDPLFEDPIEKYEQPLAPARDAMLAYQTLNTWDGNAAISDFLLYHPEHRHTVRRAQIFRVAPYGEIRDNTISDSILPIDMLRAKLSFFGATHFDPRSDRWVRICMYAGAPYPEDLTPHNADYWVYPEVAA